MTENDIRNPSDSVISILDRSILLVVLSDSRLQTWGCIISSNGTVTDLQTCRLTVGIDVRGCHFSFSQE